MLQGTKSRRCVRGEVKGTNLGRRAVDRPDEDHPHATVDLAAGLDADPLTEVAGERDVVDAVELDGAHVLEGLLEDQGELDEPAHLVGADGHVRHVQVVAGLQAVVHALQARLEVVLVVRDVLKLELGGARVHHDGVVTLADARHRLLGGLVGGGLGTLQVGDVRVESVEVGSGHVMCGSVGSVQSEGEPGCDQYVGPNVP